MRKLAEHRPRDREMAGTLSPWHSFIGLIPIVLANALEFTQLRVHGDCVAMNYALKRWRARWKLRCE